MNYVHNEKLLDCESIEINDVYAFSVAFDIIMNFDSEPQSVEECRQRDDWQKWKIAIHGELQSLRKKNVFGPAVGNRWVFVQKRNERNEIVRYDYDCNFIKPRRATSNS